MTVSSPPRVATIPRHRCRGPVEAAPRARAPAPEPPAFLGIDAEAPLKRDGLRCLSAAVIAFLGIDAEAPLKRRVLGHPAQVARHIPRHRCRGPVEARPRRRRSSGPRRPFLGIDAEAPLKHHSETCPMIATLQAFLGIDAEAPLKRKSVVVELFIHVGIPRHRCRGPVEAGKRGRAFRDAVDIPRHRCRGPVEAAFARAANPSAQVHSSASMPRPR